MTVIEKGETGVSFILTAEDQSKGRGGVQSDGQECCWKLVSCWSQGLKTKSPAHVLYNRFLILDSAMKL